MQYLITQHVALNTDLQVYIGPKGRILFDPKTNAFYLFDGKNPAKIIGAATYSSNVSSYNLVDGGTAQATKVNIISLNGINPVTVQPPPNVIGSTFKTYVTGVSPSSFAVIDFTNSLFNGTSETFVMNKNFGSCTFTFINQTLGWIITSTGL